ncbi:hypothetical protein ACIRF8_05495 [Streptomyces sp. NPDC102406]|uniref:hypothetical protein n=1 Tax=Streptomyces sp. NPDC102406 TaxID=3366171 RepID=UPI00380DEAA4
MNTQTPQAETRVRRAALLQAAFSAIRDRPETATRDELNLALRAEFRVLLPIVQTQMEAITPRTRDWYARDMAIHAANEELARGLSPSPLAAYLTLAELGRRLHVLDVLAGGGS